MKSGFELDTIPGTLDSHTSAGSAMTSDIVRVNSLRVGMRLTKGLHDAASGILLLAAGTTITPEFLKLLSDREIRYLSTSAEPVRVTISEVRSSPEIERLDLSLKPADCQIASRPLPAEQRPRISEAAFAERLARGAERHSQATRAVEKFCRSVKLEEGAKGDGLHKVVHEFMDMVSLDLDLLPTILSLQKSGDEYLFQHCVNVSAISMNIAMQLGLRREKIMEIGLAGLLSDVGMLKVPEAIRFAPRPLTTEEREEVQRHPLYTVGYLEKIAGLPTEIKYVGLQVHERMDRSGYPRMRSGGLIHAYARIVSVADAFSAMTCPRPYREALAPHDAIRCILFDCSSGKYDRDFVRALIDGLSIFPVGSIVELDDGRIARVTRGNTGLHTRPVVRTINRRTGNPDETVDLATAADLRIIRVIRDIDEYSNLR